MRVTPGLVSAQLLSELQSTLAALVRQQSRISSGRRILAPSDDPGGAAQALAIRSRQAAVEQFQRNIARARGTLESADAVLRSVVHTVTRAREIAIHGANDSNDALARQSLAREVDQLLETLVALGNSRGGQGGEFLFGGQESTVAPYRPVRDAAGQITAVGVTPRGIDGRTPAEVSDGVVVTTGVSGTTVFGPPTDTGFAFEVLIRLRDDLKGLRRLTLEPDVSPTGAANPNRYQGVDDAADFEIGGPNGTAFVGLTTAGDDPLSFSGNATSAIATAARINAVAPQTGVTATVTPARITYSRGTFAVDLALDGTAGKKLVINGANVLGAVSGASPADRRDALVALINGISGATGVLAEAVPDSDDFVLTAVDGRNISIETDGTVSPTSVNATVFGFATGLTATGSLTSVVARGGVRLDASGPVATNVAPGPAFADQIGGEGTTGIQGALDELGRVLDRATLAAAAVGGRLGWIAMLEERLKDESVVLASSLGRLEDADFLEAVESLRRMETFYEATLASGARLLEQSLLNFLR
jgi:flagellin-like hook-associated protein FlgL